MTPLEIRVLRLERRLVAHRVIVIVLACLLAAGWAERLVQGQGPSGDVLRTKGVIIEDQAGHARILIGTPIPSTGSRQRQDSMDGMLILDAAGLDRVAVGAPASAPFVRGKLYPRVSALSGVIVNDTQGNERGGIGVLDNGRAIVALDRVASEAIGMSADAASGATALTITDASSRPQLALELTASGPRVLVYDSDGKARNIAK